VKTHFALQLQTSISRIHLIVNLPEYLLLAIGSTFVIVDPIAAVPTFLGMTVRNTPQERDRMARQACIATAGVLILFALLGKWIFIMLGITLPAFQIAGGLVMMLIAYDMLHAQRSSIQETVEEKEAGVVKEDIAITPLAIPMLAGPGAISTVILLENKAQGVPQLMALYITICVVCIASYFLFHVAARGTVLFGPITMKIIARLMGLFLAAVAVQFILNGVSSYMGSPS
jgi:multiple antibiotic resistance protein